MLSHLDPRGRPRGEEGLVAIVFACVAALLLIVAALIVDLGLARDTRRQSQNAADASALAGANVLYPSTGLCVGGPLPRTPPCFTDAVQAAKDYASQNFEVTATDWSACTDPDHYYVEPGETQCISFADNTLGTSKPSQPTKLKVLVPTREVKTAFGVLAGVTKIPIDSFARASLVPGTARSCGLCILGPGISNLGNGDVTVNGGSVHSNGTVDSGPNGRLSAAPSPNAISVSGTCEGNCIPVAQTGVAPISDPYASIPMPSTVGLSVKTDPCNHGPGIYGAVSIPNTTCNLQPGLYVLTGTWENGNNTLLRGTDVTIYATCGTPTAPQVCSAGQAGGRLDTKNGNLQIVAPSTGPMTGYAIIYDRENIAALNLQGNGTSSVTGAVYASKALLEFPGNSCVSVTNGPMIVGELYGNGNTGCVNLISSIGASIPAPPAGASLDQ